MIGKRNALFGLLIALAVMVGGALSPQGALAATLYISEFASPSGSTGSTTAPGVFPQPAVTDQIVAIGGSSTQSAAFNAGTHAIQVECDSDCSVSIGANPTATTTNFLMGDGIPYQFVVVPGQKIAVIANTSGGSGSDVNIVAVGGTPVTTSLPVSVADGADVTQGAKADATCGTSSGTCSVVALLKYLLVNGIVTLESGRVPENPISGQAGVAGGSGTVGANTQRIVPAQATYVVSTSAEANHILKNAAGSLVDLEVSTGAASGFVLVFDAVSAPADGAVTPIKCWQVPANAALDKSFPIPVQFNTGITVSFSTTGCFTKTASATAFISGDIQ